MVELVERMKTDLATIEAEIREACAKARGEGCRIVSFLDGDGKKNLWPLQVFFAPGEAPGRLPVYQRWADRRWGVATGWVRAFVCGLEDEFNDIFDRSEERRLPEVYALGRQLCRDLVINDGSARREVPRA